MVNQEEIETAIEVLADLERAEADSDHQRILAEVRRMVVGVYDMEMFMSDFEGDERVQTLKDVLESIDPDDQHYTDAEEVERYKESGLEFAELYDR